MKKLLIIVGVVLLILLSVFGWIKGGYDQAVSIDENVKSSWAQVENQLQRRNDLVPNLVNTVKGYASQEKEIFTEVARLRSQWGEAKTINEKVDASNQMNGALSRLLLVAENYPQLKSNQNFLALQSQLEGTENRISVERMRYNSSVQMLNTYQRKFFGRFFCNMAGITEPAKYFEADKAAQKVPQVQF